MAVRERAVHKNFSQFKDTLDLKYTVQLLYFSIMTLWTLWKTQLDIETNIIGKKSLSYICTHTIICHHYI